MLPRSAFGPAASKLPIDSSSGVTSNKAASDDSIDPGITTAYPTKIGRTTGYDLSFQSASALAGRSGVVELTSEVDLFKSASGASALLHRYPADLQGMAGKTVGTA